MGLKQEAKGGCRSLKSEELHTVCSTPLIRMTISRNIRWKRDVVNIGQMGNACNILIRNFERTTLEIHRLLEG